jgi:hypothetical protein
MKTKGKTRACQVAAKYSPIYGVAGLTRKPVTRAGSSWVFLVVEGQQTIVPDQN